MFINRLTLLFQTIRHLKTVQIRYQIWYRIKFVFRSIFHIKYPLNVSSTSFDLDLIPWIKKPETFKEPYFTFLNMTHECEINTKRLPEIEWNKSAFDKLWVYNLNYMDYILQPSIKNTTAKLLINSFVFNLSSYNTGLDSYPISLRGINWIKFFSANKIKDDAYDNSLYAQYNILYKNLEYNILGNHLLENGFSLLFGAFYFKDQVLYEKAYKIILSEMNEQILKDGGHFELSPMYHQIILDRVLDCINLMQNNKYFPSQEELLLLLQEKSRQMILWLNAMTFNSGEIPLFNDSTKEIAPTTSELNDYAVALGIITEDKIRNFQSTSCGTYLGDSGYRRFNSLNYECIIDVGPIGPDYQPGHGHADTFGLVLNIKNDPFIIDPGISTYDNNKLRLEEKGTRMHNTVSVKDQNSSDIWSSFRVGQRAKVTILKAEDNYVCAMHDGYKKIGSIHQREWKFQENMIEVTDTLKGKTEVGSAYFILQPGLLPLHEGCEVKTANGVFRFENYTDIALDEIQIPNGFNKFQDAWRIKITFSSWLISSITF